jgi:hypothetical protein
MLMPHSEIVLTFDVDWAPDFILNHVAGFLIERNVKSTWFITHPSPAVERLRQYPHLFELGIHPNFKPASTHGNDPQEVIDYCLSLVPNAKSVRTHSLFQSSPILDLLIGSTSCSHDVSLFLPRTPCLRPVEYIRGGKKLIRIPYVWEDDFEMDHPAPFWHIGQLLTIGDGLKVLNFHPIHIYLNSETLDNYTSLLRHDIKYGELTESIAEPFVHHGTGTKTMFLEVLDYLQDIQRDAYFISELDYRGMP